MDNPRDYIFFLVLSFALACEFIIAYILIIIWIYEVVILQESNKWFLFFGLLFMAFFTVLTYLAWKRY